MDSKKDKESDMSKSLKEVLESHGYTIENWKTRAYRLSGEIVKTVHNEAWPGTHKNVVLWVELECGPSVGVNVSGKGVSFPVHTTEEGREVYKAHKERINLNRKLDTKKRDCVGCYNNRYNMGPGYCERPGVDAVVTSEYCWLLEDARYVRSRLVSTSMMPRNYHCIPLVRRLSCFRKPGYAQVDVRG